MTFDREYFNLGYLDSLSYQDTAVHRLDPRAKLIATLVFILCVVSYPHYEIRGLIPFFLFPVIIISMADIPPLFILKKILLVLPFAFFVGIANPFLDTRPMIAVSGISLSGGWISFFSIIIKFLLTISAALLLIATTSFPGVCRGLRKMGMPDIFISQMLFLYRYLFVLLEESMRLARARDMRSFGKKGLSMGVFTNLVGMLFVRTMERAERIYMAMLSRGFQGELATTRPHRFSLSDLFYLLAVISAFFFLRIFDVVGLIGRFAAGRM